MTRLHCPQCGIPTIEDSQAYLSDEDMTCDSCHAINERDTMEKTLNRPIHYPGADIPIPAGKPTYSKYCPSCHCEIDSPEGFAPSGICKDCDEAERIDAAEAQANKLDSLLALFWIDSTHLLES
jgi:hypothetical protein